MIVVLLCSIVFLVWGLVHYAGYAKPMVFSGIFGRYMYLNLGMAWFGASGLLSSIGLLLSDAGFILVSALVMIPAIICFFITLLSIVWLPRRLRPSWLREWMDRGSPIEEAKKWSKWRRDNNGS